MSWPAYLAMVTGSISAVGGLIWWLVRRAKSAPPPPGAAEALDLVMGFYGLTREQRPYLQFIRGADLNCGGGRAFKDLYGKCIQGNTRVTAKVITLAWWEGCSWSTSALSHEATHFWLEIRGGAPDYEHKDPAFAPGGAASQLRDALDVWEREMVKA
jgi:hypothetical protein